MRSGGNPGVGHGEPYCTEANDPKCNSGNCPNTLYIVGIGPGSLRHLSGRAVEVLKSADSVAGYTLYIDLIRPLISDKHIISTGMTKEVERVDAAIRLSLSGKSCAIVSSGDPGIYAMAGLVFEMCRKENIRVTSQPVQDHRSLCVEVVPGIPALCSCASLLGAPIGHDFAVISLSDLLTPWEIIEKRISAAADADFIIVLYNPKSRKRTWQLEKTCDIVLKYRSGDTPVGIVTAAMRENRKIQIVSLDELASADVTMQSTVFIGNNSSVRYLDYIISPRGYSNKYEL